MPLPLDYKSGFLDFSTINCHSLLEIQFLPYANTCQFWKDASLFESVSFGGKILTSQSIKGKTNISFLIFLPFPLSSSSPFFNSKPRVLLIDQIMGVKRGLWSSSTKFAEPSASKGNKPLLGRDENPSIEEQWIIPPFFEDYLFYKSLDWDSTPCSEDPPYTACGEPDDLLTMDLELKHIPRLSTCKGDFTPTIDVVFKSHTSISKG